MGAPQDPNTDMFKNIGAAVEEVAHAEDITQDDNTAGDDVNEPQIVDNIESLCMNCHEQGTTRLLLTRIPFFREVVLMSFDCPHCHFRNSEVQSAGTIQERGSRYTLHLENSEDLNRQLIKSETCVSRIPELDLEIPAQRGQLTNPEGLINTVLEDLETDQDARKEQDPEAWEQIQKFIQKGRDFLEGKHFPFKIELDDPAGNSWIEPKPTDPRGKWTRAEYLRTPEQNLKLGLTDTTGDQQKEEPEDVEIRPDEVHTFPATCPSCARPCNTHMKLVDIPHFQEVIIMSTVCNDCGYKSNEVKTGGAVPSKGRIITLHVEDEEDLARDILKSETCALSCPELNLDLQAGTLGGRFTTLEGLLTNVHDDLYNRIFSEVHDSLETESAERWKKFFAGLKEAIEGKRKFTVILDDPLAASYVQNICAPDPDPQLEIVDVDRTKEQEDDLGISDMRVEGYEEDAEKERVEKEKAEKEKEDKTEGEVKA